MRQRGFSLVELLLVVAAFAVIASMTVPALNAVRNNFRLNAARDELVGTFEMARSAAIKLDSNTTITLSSSGEYRVQYTSNGTTRSIAYTLPTGVSFNLPSGVTSITLTCTHTGKVTMVTNAGASVTGVTVSNVRGSRTLYINVAGNLTIAAT